MMPDVNENATTVKIHAACVQKIFCLAPVIDG